MRAVVLLLIAAMLAGCAGTPEEGDAAVAGESQDEVAQTDSGAYDENGTPLPVVAVLQVFAAGNVTAPENGTLSVLEGINLTFDASMSQGNITSYNWTIGNATYDNVTIVHAFDAGNHTVNLTVSDLFGQNATVSLNVTAQAVLAPTAVMVGTASTTYSQASSNVAPGACIDKTGTFDIPRSEDGAPVFAGKIVIKLNPAATLGLNMRYKVWLDDPSGQQIGAAAANNNAAKTIKLDNVELEGGEYTIRSSMCAPTTGAGSGVRYTVTGDADLYAWQ